MIVLAAQGKLDSIVGGPIDEALFANVGDNAEHPDTIAYVHDVMIPWSKSNGITINELRQPHNRDLYDELMNPDNKYTGIPFRFPSGAPAKRSCTVKYKIETVGKYIKSQCNCRNTHHTNSGSKLTIEDVHNIRFLSEQGFSIRAIAKECAVTKSQVHNIVNNQSWLPNRAPEAAIVCIGISTDEIQRINTKRAQHWEKPIYPLIELNLSRDDCKKVITEAGLPVPPKSACWFCPFHRKSYFEDLQKNRPELWSRHIALENTLRIKTGINISITDPRFGFNDGKCDEGYCWT
jgi:hypothetical protein